MCSTSTTSTSCGAIKGDLRLVCIFVPALTGTETHRSDGSYAPDSAAGLEKHRAGFRGMLLEHGVAGLIDLAQDHLISPQIGDMLQDAPGVLLP